MSELEQVARRVWRERLGPGPDFTESLLAGGQAQTLLRAVEAGYAAGIEAGVDG